MTDSAQPTRGSSRQTQVSPAQAGQTPSGRSPAGASQGRSPAGGFSLASRIFLLLATLLVLALGAAVLMTFVIGQNIARKAVNSALERSAEVQRSVQQQYEAQLRQLASAFTDPYIRAYLAEGIGNADAASVRDLLVQRQNELGFNFAMALDGAGNVVARTDRQPPYSGNFLSRPLVARARQDLGRPMVGVWSEDEGLYRAVVLPLTTEFDVVGWLVSGFKIDELVARDLERASGTKVAFVQVSEGGPRVVATTLDEAGVKELTKALRLTSGSVALRSSEGGRLDVTLNGEPWVAKLAPLSEAKGESQGAVVTLASLKEQMKPFRQILWTLLLGGLGALAAALGLSFGLSRRTLGPIRRLVASTEAARQGDYDQSVPVERGDEVGRLARAFNDLLSNLREKRDMESYLSDLSRTLPEPGQAGTAIKPAETQRRTLVGVELRRYARSQAIVDPEQSVQRLSRDLRRTATAVMARHGRVEGGAGHRVLLSFEGEGRTLRALSAATEILAAVSSTESAFDEPAEPLIALVSGETVSGSVVWGEGPESAVLGPPVQRLEAMMREATPGEIVLSKEVHEELTGVLAAAGVQTTEQRGVLAPVQFHALSGSEAARITGVNLSAAAAPTQVLEKIPSASGLGPGKVLGGRFEILSLLGAGGMGMVFKARDRELSDLVALKVLKREAWEDPTQLERLKQELRLARKITHPNVLRTHDFGELDGVQFISMEYVRGVTLRYMLDQTDRLPFSAGLRVVRQLCAGLGAAHAQGVVHRDIKPDNVILDQAGNAKLMDFGIARPIQRPAGSGVTREGFIVGTPQFMAPEQLQGLDLDARTDIYACGVVLYEIFTGRLPFNADQPMQIVLQHLNDAPPPPSQFWPEIPPQLEQIILACLAKKPQDRFASAQQLERALEGLQA